MKKVRVDFNDAELGVSQRVDGVTLKQGERVFAYTTDDERPFGVEAIVTRVRPAQGEWGEFYWLQPVEGVPYLDLEEWRSTMEGG